jgi:hypothetical protein
MLLIDGVKYVEWTPTSEGEVERMVEEHAKDIFGEQSIYLEKHRLRTKSGIGSIPDGYVIVFGDSPQWHIVEVELSSHPLHEHIVSQISKFINGIRNPLTLGEIVGAVYAEITRDDFLTLKVKQAVKSTEIYKFLSDLISKLPAITIIVEKHTEQLNEAVNILRYPQIKVVEFQTFTREGVGLAVHTHLFEPLYLEKPNEQIPTKPSPTGEGTELTILEHTLKADELKYKRFRLLKDERSFFPPVGQKFQIKVDGDSYTTNVSNEKPPRMRYLKPWFRKHSSLKAGDKVIFTLLNPNLYQLTS